MENEWEEVIAFDMDRMMVPGGWLVRLDHGEGLSICFYPDPEHKWKL